jgi:glutamate---cysteine ligase / carboxylate-amine ligase
VLELKVSEPVATLEGLDGAFAACLTRVLPVLEGLGVMPLPGGMHPTMDPEREMVLWPHGNSEVYRAFDRVFDCRGHGWANLQACHLNLPFSTCDKPEDEFGVLHAAVRALLPIMPALSASSPFVEGVATGVMDNRLEVYRTNSRRVPEAAGLVIPERAYTRGDYERVVLGEVYRGYAPHDPEGVLRDEWANARGAIARFSRNTIEVRVLDVQECPRADIAVVSAITEVLRALAERRLGNLAVLRAWGVEALHAVLLGVIRGGDGAVIENAGYLRDLGYVGPVPAPAGRVWEELVGLALGGREPAWRADLAVILGRGCLAGRIMRATPTPGDIPRTYRRLAECLSRNALFEV